MHQLLLQILEKHIEKQMISTFQSWFNEYGMYIYGSAQHVEGAQQLLVTIIFYIWLVVTVWKFTAQITSVLISI